MLFKTIRNKEMTLVEYIIKQERWNRILYLLGVGGGGNTRHESLGKAGKDVCGKLQQLNSKQ